MNENTLRLFEAFAEMQTTQEIAQEFDKVIAEIGNADGSRELVAAVLLAQLRTGKATIKMQDTQ